MERLRHSTFSFRSAAFFKTRFFPPQLELTENFLNSQKKLYTAFVGSLNSAAVQQQLQQEQQLQEQRKLLHELQKSSREQKKGSNSVKKVALHV
jgi:hypothetical protein